MTSMRYDDRNGRAIQSLHPAVRHKVLQALEDLTMIGEDCLITSGFRTTAEQASLYAQGRTTPGKIVTYSRPGWSFHEYGLAIDLVAVGPLGVELSQRTKLEWAALARYEVYGRSLQDIGFQWGFQLWGFDRPHFQYTQGLTIGDVRAGRRPDIEQAKRERVGALQDRILLATRALESPAVTQKRKQELRVFIETMSRREQEILGE